MSPSAGAESRDPVDSLTIDDVRGVARALASAPECAVDIEADALHAFRPRLCFVQIAVDDGIHLIDALASDVSLEPLTDAFANPRLRKFFHAAGGDLQYLAAAGVRVRGLFDTHRAATLLGRPKVGLADLARELVQVELTKEHQQFDFSIRPLPVSVREYIADDVRYLVEIGRQIRAACEAADILEEVELDCRRLEEEAAAPPDIGADYSPKVPRTGMSPSEYALARTLADVLHARRLVWAEAANVPMGRMLSNAALTGLVVRRPATLDALRRVQGVRGEFVRSRGAETLAIIAETSERVARGDMAWNTPRGDAAFDPGRRRRADALKAFRNERAALRNVTPSIVLPTPILEAIAATPPRDVGALAAIPYFGEKRLALYGEALAALIASL